MISQVFGMYNSMTIDLKTLEQLEFISHLYLPLTIKLQFLVISEQGSFAVIMSRFLPSADVETFCHQSQPIILICIERALRLFHLNCLVAFLSFQESILNPLQLITYCLQLCKRAKLLNLFPLFLLLPDRDYYLYSFIFCSV